MGRGRRSGRRGGNNKLGSRDSAPGGSWKDIPRENARWESYYKQQGLIPESQWDLFKKTCQDPLPLTFRVTGSRKHADEIKTIFVEKHLPLLTNLKIEDVENYSPPKELPWYPNSLGYQVDLPKTVIKKNELFAKTQRFLVIETEVGNISRQEAVSMIPPLVLDVKPEHHVLDMCAAPGSKTAQLVEALHSNDDEKAPTGFVVANDSDYKRSHMLVHQIKRLNSPNFVVVNHDAQMFPKLKLTPDSGYLKFDRILCDVPCSGDGTMRKNINVWPKWTPGDALGLHPLQVNILNRGLQLLEKGGRLVYSTCSLSPIENEAVVAAALRKWGNQVKLINCDDRLPNLVREKGISNWKVFNKSMELVEAYDENSNIPKTCFPPTEEEASKFHLDNCIRVYPHLQNTGGFFITVFEKVDNSKRSTDEVEEPETVKKSKTESGDSIKKNAPAKKERLPRDANEEPFIFLDPHQEQLEKCWNFYDFDDSFAKDCTLVRNATGEPIRTIYYVSPGIKNLISTNEAKLKIVHTGTKLFVSQRSDSPDQACAWRAQNESVQLIKKFLSPKRIFDCNLDVLLVLLKEAFPNLQKLAGENLDDAFVSAIQDVEEGCCFISVKRGEHEEDLFLPLWKGKLNINLMVSKQETYELLYRIYGIETDKNAAYKQKPSNDVEQTISAGPSTDQDSQHTTSNPSVDV